MSLETVQSIARVLSQSAPKLEELQPFVTPKTPEFTWDSGLAGQDILGLEGSFLTVARWLAGFSAPEVQVVAESYIERDRQGSFEFVFSGRNDQPLFQGVITARRWASNHTIAFRGSAFATFDDQDKLLKLKTFVDTARVLAQFGFRQHARPSPVA